MTWGLVAGAAATVIGGAVSANGAAKGSKAQITASRAAGLQEQQASQNAQRIQQTNLDRTRADSAPWVNAGEGALNQLAWKMGVQPTNRIDPNPQRSLADFTGDLQASGKYNQIWGKRMDLQRTDMQGLNAEANQLFAAQQAKQQATPQFHGDQADFGSLSRNFTSADMNADPVYQSGLQFGLDQGTQGLNNQAAAGGMQLSGQTLKQLSRFGNDYATTKAQGSYDRFNNNRTMQYNQLAGISGTGQQQVNQIGAAGQNFANNVGNGMMNAGNNMAQNTLAAGQARASGYANQGNAINGAMGSLVNQYQQQQWMNKLNPQPSTQPYSQQYPGMNNPQQSNYPTRPSSWSI